MQDYFKYLQWLEKGHGVLCPIYPDGYDVENSFNDMQDAIDFAETGDIKNFAYIDGCEAFWCTYDLADLYEFQAICAEY